MVEIGQTQQMFAIAEIYENDIPKIKKGQSASITSDALSKPLTGKVDHIGLLVQKQTVIDTNPAANIDDRVVEVKIRLDQTSSQKVSQLNNLQVTVSINYDQTP